MESLQTIRKAAPSLRAICCAALLALLLGLASALCPKQAAAAASDFYDTPSGEWYVQEGWIDYVTNNGIMSGYASEGVPTGVFGPEDQITRGQVVTVLFRIANPGDRTTVDPDQFAPTSGFLDGNYPDYFNSAIQWASSLGIVTGYTTGPDAGCFRPNYPVTRAELATMVCRFAGVMGIDVSSYDTSAFYAAVDTSDVMPFAVETMMWCADRGLINGNKHGENGPLTLEPQRGATRAQAAKVFTVLLRDVLSGTVHQHQWQAHETWVSNIVTVVDVPEQVIRGAQFYVEDGDGDPNTLTSKGGPIYWFEDGFTMDDLEEIIMTGLRNADENGLYNGVYYGNYVNVEKTIPAQTHTEDHGSYQVDYYYCSCGATMPA